jgi:alkaline phosphatase D
MDSIMSGLQKTRRELIKALALATIAIPLSNSVWAQKKFDKNPFILGVASGSPTDQSIVLWTRLVDEGVFGSNLPNEPIEVKWELALDREFSKIIKSGVSLAVPALAYSVHTEVKKLPANQWFFYRFQVGGAISSVGRTRTLPAADQAVAQLRLAYASCQQYEHGFFSAYKHMLAENLDLVLFLGDYIYEYGPSWKGVRVHDSPPVISLDDYRKRYVLYKQDKNLQAMHAACPWLMTWDDHEVQNDYAGLNPGTFGPYVSDFPKRRAAAYQAYYEHMPIPSSALIDGVDGLIKGSEMRIYGDFRYGKLANICVLDDRQYRDSDVCTPSGNGSSIFDPKTCPELENAGRTILGDTQEKWLVGKLKDSNKNIWNVVGQPTLYAQRYLPSSDKLLIWNDGWDGFPAARKRIDQALIDNKVKNLVIFGGDVHENWVGYVKADYNKPDSTVLGVEFCGTSITSIGDGGKYLDARLARNPHFVFAEATKKGYGVAEFTPNALTVNLRVVSNAQQEDATIETLAKFLVRAGSNKIERIS